MDKRIFRALIFLLIGVSLLVVVFILINRDTNKSSTVVTDDITACVQEPDSDNLDHYQIDDELSNKQIEIQFGEEKIIFNTNQNYTVHELDALYSDVPMQVALNDSTHDFSNMKLSVNGEEIKKGGTQLSIDQLDKNKFLNVTLEYKDYKRNYCIQTLPDDFPEIEKYGISEYGGEYYANFFAPSYILKMSEEGDILYYKKAENDQTLALFTKWKIGEKVRYSYFAERNTGVINRNSYNYGDMIIMDENYKVIDIVHSLPSEKFSVDTNHNLEMHDFIMIDDGHYMLMNYVIDTPDKQDLSDTLKLNSRVFAAYVQEIKDDKIIWEWISTDYPEFYASSIEGNDYSNSDTYAADYMHINSLFIDPRDKNVIMSFRNQDSIVKVDKTTSEILWRFGGKNDDFNLSDYQKTSRQHHATITSNGNLLIFDNGTLNKQTRIIEAKLDETEKRLVDYKEFKIDGAFSEFTGSVQKINEDNDVFIIGWGMNRTQQPMMSVIDFRNQKVLTEVIEPNMEVDSYRFIRVK